MSVYGKIKHFACKIGVSILWETTWQHAIYFKNRKQNFFLVREIKFFFLNLKSIEHENTAVA